MLNKFDFHCAGLVIGVNYLSPQNVFHVISGESDRERERERGGQQEREREREREREIK